MVCPAHGPMAQCAPVREGFDEHWECEHCGLRIVREDWSLGVFTNDELEAMTPQQIETAKQIAKAVKR
jgi:hypothetical protein